jgi:superfamily II DNA or RNA helicase
MKKLREYQQELLDEILKEIPNHNRLCVQLSTGGGKTVIFTEMINQLNSKTLILVDSIDLVHQTNETFKKQGIDVGMVLAGNKKFPENKVIVAMVSTLWNRVKKNTMLLNDIQYCVIDECHVWIFNKLFDFLPNAKILGFTATPVRLKRYKLDEETTAMEVMADVYDKLICGKPINWLMENNYLVRDKNYLIDFDSSGLKTDSSGEFTVESMKKVFQHEDYKKALRNTYEIYCEDKKTMIFTASTETNAIFAELFKDKNVKTYDSVNNNTNERDSIIEWFKNTPDAILINTGCFTKGFDVCDVEAIIVARATKSLALWIQICGRGARITNKIKKDNIIIIDGGNNIEEHGTFSFNRNWNKIFSDRKIKLILEPQQECEACGFTFDEKDSECPNCGHIVPIIEVDFEIEKEKKQFTINGQKAKLEPPTMDVNFFINKGSTDYEALKILSEKWINFISKSKIEEKDFKYHWKKGTFQQRFDVLLKPQYLQIIRSILKKGKNVIYKNYCEKILTKAYYKKYGTN